MVTPSVDPPNPLPLWRNPAFAKHIVKGNFMTLSAQPKSVEQGEWMAHQGKTLWRCLTLNSILYLTAFLVVEHYRNLLNITRVVYEKEDNGESICNRSTCSKMSAGRYVVL